MKVPPVVRLHQGAWKSAVALRAGRGIVQTQRKPARTRNGTTILGMMVVVSLLGIVMGLCLSIMVLCLKTDKKLAASLHQRRDIQRLSRQIREDGHRATLPQLQLTAADRMLTIQSSPAPGSPALTDSEITYQQQGQKVVRQARNPAGELTTQETYLLPEHYQVQWKILPEKSLLTCELVGTLEYPRSAGSWAVEILTRVGKWQPEPEAVPQNNIPAAAPADTPAEEAPE